MDEYSSTNNAFINTDQLLKEAINSTCTNHTHTWLLIYIVLYITKLLLYNCWKLEERERASQIRYGVARLDFGSVLYSSYLGGAVYGWAQRDVANSRYCEERAWLLIVFQLRPLEDLVSSVLRCSISNHDMIGILECSALNRMKDEQREEEEEEKYTVTGVSSLSASPVINVVGSQIKQKRMRRVK